MLDHLGRQAFKVFSILPAVKTSRTKRSLEHMCTLFAYLDIFIRLQRHLGPAASAAAAAGPATITPGMSEDDAHAIAESEGLTLVPSHKSASGYLNVSRSSGGSKKPWKVQVRCRALGRRFKRDLGQFDSAPEAALAYARHLGKVASAQEAANSGLLAAGERSREDGVAEDGDEGEDDNEGEDAQCDKNEGEAEDEHAEAEAREDAVQLVEEDGGDVNEEEEQSELAMDGRSLTYDARSPYSD